MLLINKKTVLSALILSVMTASSAHAGSGEVRFIGSVTATTCDLRPEVNGSVNNLLQLGSAKLNSAGTPVEFKLALNPDQPDCGALADDQLASIAWAGSFNKQGLENQSGAATDAWVKLATVNAKDTPVFDISSSKSSAEFTGAALKADGAKFTAVLNGGAIPGDYQSAAAFVVSYK